MGSDSRDSTKVLSSNGESMSESVINEIPEIITEILDYEPKHRRYPPDTLFKETSEVSLVEFLEKVESTQRFNKLENLFKIKDVISKYTVPLDDHGDIFIPYGHALLVLVEGLDKFKDYSFQMHPNPGIRLLVAFNTKSKEILDQLSYDRCALVRAEVAKNPNSSNEALDMLSGSYLHEKDPFLYVRQFLEAEINIPETSDPGDLVYNLELGECACNNKLENRKFEEFFEGVDLEIPAIATFFERDITNYGNWNWATQPYPHRNQDYLMESVEYLKRSIPDQYSLNHAGHGVNSYSLNFRCAIGNIAIFAQVGWGGMYMDSKDQADKWDETQQILTHILLRNSDFESNEIKMRKFLIVHSDFRLDEPELWTQSNQIWTKLDYIHDWDQIVDYLKQHNELDPEYKKMFVPDDED